MNESVLLRRLSSCRGRLNVVIVMIYCYYWNWYWSYWLNVADRRVHLVLDGMLGINENSLLLRIRVRAPVCVRPSSVIAARQLGFLLLRLWWHLLTSVCRCDLILSLTTVLTCLALVLRRVVCRLES